MLKSLKMLELLLQLLRKCKWEGKSLHVYIPRVNFVQIRFEIIIDENLWNKTKFSSPLILLETLKRKLELGRQEGASNEFVY